MIQVAQELASMVGVAPACRVIGLPRATSDNPNSGPSPEACVRAFCGDFFDWYNNEHRHSGIAMLTPAQVHCGNPNEVLQRRRQVPMAAWLAHPERFTKGMPRLRALPSIAWINPPPESPDAAVPELA